MKGGRRAAAPRLLRAFFAVAALLSVAAAGCRSRSDSSPDISVQEQVTPQPPQVGAASVAVQLADASQRPVTHAAIMVEADMSHPGMSPSFAQATESAPGSYRANVNFNMGGDWVLLLHIKLADGRKIERQLDVRGVRSN